MDHSKRSSANGRPAAHHGPSGGTIGPPGRLVPAQPQPLRATIMPKEDISSTRIADNPSDSYLSRMATLESYLNDVASCTSRISEKLTEVDNIPLKIEIDDLYSGLASLPHTPSYLSRTKGLTAEFLNKLNVELYEASVIRAQTSSRGKMTASRQRTGRNLVGALSTVEEVSGVLDEVQETPTAQLNRERQSQVEANEQAQRELQSRCSMLKSRTDRQRQQNEGYANEIAVLESKLVPELQTARGKARKSKTRRTEIILKLKLLEFISKTQDVPLPELAKRPEENKPEEDDFLKDAESFNVRPLSYAQMFRPLVVTSSSAASVDLKVEKLPDEFKIFIAVALRDELGSVEGIKKETELVDAATDAIVCLRPSNASNNPNIRPAINAISKAKLRSTLSQFYNLDSRAQVKQAIEMAVSQGSLPLDTDILLAVTAKLAALRQSLVHEDSNRYGRGVHEAKITKIDAILSFLGSVARALASVPASSLAPVAPAPEPAIRATQLVKKVITLGRIPSFSRSPVKSKIGQPAMEPVQIRMSVDTMGVVDVDSYRKAMEAVETLVDCNVPAILRRVTHCRLLKFPTLTEANNVSQQAAAATSKSKPKKGAKGKKVAKLKATEMEENSAPVVPVDRTAPVFPYMVNISLMFAAIHSVLCTAAYASFINPLTQFVRQAPVLPASSHFAYPAPKPTRSSMVIKPTNNSNSHGQNSRASPPLSQEGNLLFDLREACDLLFLVCINLSENHCIGKQYEKQLKARVESIAMEVRIPTSSQAESNETYQKVKDLTIELIQYLMTTTPQIILVKDKGSLFSVVLRNVLALLSVVMHSTDPQWYPDAAYPEGMTKNDIEGRMLQIISLVSGYQETPQNPKVEPTETVEVPPELLDPSVRLSAASVMDVGRRNSNTTTTDTSDFTMPFWLCNPALMSTIDEFHQDPPATHSPIYQKPGDLIESIGSCVRYLCHTDKTCMQNYRQSAPIVYGLVSGYSFAYVQATTSSKSTDSSGSGEGDYVSPLVPDKYQNDQQFTTRHHHGLLVLEVLLYSISHVHKFTKSSLNAKFEQAIKQAEHFISSSIVRSGPGSSQDAAYYSDFVIPVHDINKLLSQCLPEALPGIIALELHRRVLLEELSRRHMLQRLIAGDEDMKDLQFLNPTMPSHIDVFIAKIKLDLHKLSEAKAKAADASSLSKSNNGRRRTALIQPSAVPGRGGGVMVGAQPNIGTMNTQWQDDMSRLVISQCSLLEHLLWGHVKKRPMHPTVSQRDNPVVSNTTTVIVAPPPTPAPPTKTPNKAQRPVKGNKKEAAVPPPVALTPVVIPDPWLETEFMDPTMSIPVMPLPDDLKSRLWFYTQQLRDIALARQNVVSQTLIEELEPSFKQCLKDMAIVRYRILEVVTAFSLPWKSRLVWLSQQHAHMIKEIEDGVIQQAALEARLGESDAKLEELKGLLSEVKGKKNKDSEFVVTAELEQRLFGEDMMSLDSRIAELSAQLVNAKDLYNTRRREHTAMVSAEVIGEGTRQLLEWRQRDHLMTLGLIPWEDHPRPWAKDDINHQSPAAAVVVVDNYEEDSDFEESDLHHTFLPRSLSLGSISLNEDTATVQLGNSELDHPEPPPSDTIDDSTNAANEEEPVQMLQSKKGTSFKTLQTAVVMANQFLNASKDIFQKRKIDKDVLEEAYTLPKRSMAVLKPPGDVVSEEELSTLIDAVMEESEMEVEELVAAAATGVDDSVPMVFIGTPSTHPAQPIDNQKGTSERMVEKLLNKLKAMRVAKSKQASKAPVQVITPFKERSNRNGFMNTSSFSMQAQTSQRIKLSDLGGQELVLDSLNDDNSTELPRHVARIRDADDSNYQKMLKDMSASLLDDDDDHKPKRGLSRSNTGTRDGSKRVLLTPNQNQNQNQQVSFRLPSESKRGLAVGSTAESVDESIADSEDAVSLSARKQLSMKGRPRTSHTAIPGEHPPAPLAPPPPEGVPSFFLQEQKEALRQLIHDAFRAEFPKLPSQLPFHFATDSHPSSRLIERELSGLLVDANPVVMHLRQPSLTRMMLDVASNNQQSADESHRRPSTAPGLIAVVVQSAEAVAETQTNDLTLNQPILPGNNNINNSTTDRQQKRAASSSLKKEKARTGALSLSDRIPYREVIQMVSVKKLGSRRDESWHEGDPDRIERVMTPIAFTSTASVTSGIVAPVSRITVVGGTATAAPIPLITPVSPSPSLLLNAPSVDAVIDPQDHDLDHIRGPAHPEFSIITDDTDLTHVNPEFYVSLATPKSTPSASSSFSKLSLPGTPSALRQNQPPLTAGVKPVPLSAAALSGYIQSLHRAKMAGKDSGPALGTRAHTSLFASPEKIASTTRLTEAREMQPTLTAGWMSPSSHNSNKPLSANSTGSGKEVGGKNLRPNTMSSQQPLTASIPVEEDGSDQNQNNERKSLLSLLADDISLFTTNIPAKSSGLLPSIKTPSLLVSDTPVVTPSGSLPSSSNSYSRGQSADINLNARVNVALMAPKSPKPPTYAYSPANKRVPVRKITGSGL